jgi:beta-N-acetylhexosaminidase
MSANPMNQILVTGVPGLTLDAETAKMFRSVQPGGYILFARNIVSAPQLRKLIDDLRDLSDVEPIIMVDEEGGRVSRLRQIGNELPSPQQYRERGRRDLVTRHGALTGQLMRLFGMNLNLCPVVEVSFDVVVMAPLLSRSSSLRANSIRHYVVRGYLVVGSIFQATRV